jgi:molybdopterin/thiamine biosynthesis adenylyltransferase
MKLYIEDATFFGAEDATFFDDDKDDKDITINDDEKFSLKNLNKVLIHSESRIAARRKLAKTIKTTLNLDKM